MMNFRKEFQVRKKCQDLLNFVTFKVLQEKPVFLKNEVQALRLEVFITFVAYFLIKIFLIKKAQFIVILLLALQTKKLLFALLKFGNCFGFRCFIKFIVWLWLLYSCRKSNVWYFIKIAHSNTLSQLRSQVRIINYLGQKSETVTTKTVTEFLKQYFLNFFS